MSENNQESARPLHRVVGHVLHCWENTFSFPVSSSFIDEPILPEMCEFLIRVPSKSATEIIAKCKAYSDVDVLLVECPPNPEVQGPNGPLQQLVGQ